jgi:hypothetical protein
LRINHGDGLIDRGGSGHRLASEVCQHVFNAHKDQHFVLDNEDPPTGKQFLSHEPHGAGMFIVQTTPSER